MSDLSKKRMSHLLVLLQEFWSGPTPHLRLQAAQALANYCLPVGIIPYGADCNSSFQFACVCLNKDAQFTIGLPAGSNRVWIQLISPCPGYEVSEGRFNDPDLCSACQSGQSLLCTEPLVVCGEQGFECKRINNSLTPIQCEEDRFLFCSPNGLVTKLLPDGTAPLPPLPELVVDIDGQLCVAPFNFGCGALPLLNLLCDDDLLVQDGPEVAAQQFGSLPWVEKEDAFVICDGILANGPATLRKPLPCDSDLLAFDSELIRAPLQPIPEIQFSNDLGITEGFLMCDQGEIQVATLAAEQVMFPLGTLVATCDETLVPPQLVLKPFNPTLGTLFPRNVVVVRSTLQIISAGTTSLLTYSTETYDPTNLWNANIYTVPQTGLYQVSVTIHVTLLSANDVQIIGTGGEIPFAPVFYDQFEPVLDFLLRKFPPFPMPPIPSTLALVRRDTREISEIIPPTDDVQYIFPMTLLWTGILNLGELVFLAFTNNSNVNNHPTVLVNEPINSRQSVLTIKQIAAI